MTGERAKAAPKSRIGRPSPEESRRRLEQLLDVALDIFLERGYVQTTVMEVAAAVGMSKRTIYAHFADKEQLFRAAVRLAIDRYTITEQALESLAGLELEALLLAIARQRIANIAARDGLRLQRILNAEAHRFPELFALAVDVGVEPTVHFLIERFEAANASGEIAVSDCRQAALSFIGLSVGGPARLITLGRPIDEAEIERSTRFNVSLFLNGARPR